MNIGSLKSMNSCRLIMLTIVFWFYLLEMSSSLNCTWWKARYENLRKKHNHTDDTTEFGRGGFAETKKQARVGSTVTFVCDHLIYWGESSYPPPVTVEWYKNDRPLIDIKRKRIIGGCIKRPLISGIWLKIFNASPSDEGVYTCKFVAISANRTRIRSVSENITLHIEYNATYHASTISNVPGNVNNATNSTVLPLSNSPGNLFEWNVELTAVVIVSMFCCVLFFVLVASFYATEQSCPRKVYLAITGKELKLERRNNTADDKLEEGVRFYSDTKTFGEEPTYVNDERYRDLFPFITEDEWELLKKNRIDRSIVHCGVQYSMPIVLGTGNFGHVYSGQLSMRDGTKKDVAVKRLNDGYKSRELGHFISEAVTLLKCGQHCNIINLIGSSLLDALGDAESSDSVRRPPILVLELASEGNLKNYLYNRRLEKIVRETSPWELKIDSMASTDVDVGKGISLKDLTSFAYQAARGMEHLANKRIIHRDLAARNVLLTSDRVVKIADFGLSKYMRNEYYKVHAPAVAPAKWTAPEALWENKFSIKSDVWSYGILVWEIYSMGEQPYLGIPAQTLYRKLASGIRLGKPQFCNEPIYNVLRRCWSWKVEKRPSFVDLVRYFDATISSVEQSYIDLSQPCKSLLTPTGSSCQNSEVGSDSVFDYSEMMSVAVDPRSIHLFQSESQVSYGNMIERSATLESNDSSYFTQHCGSSASSTISGDTLCEFSFSGLANPMYQAQAAVE